ncbi:hypothetical protein evm_013951 [Chilo suppressalis]|nr:hypothetical protein evm_013951 [Chilo suppressalis]
MPYYNTCSQLINAQTAQNLHLNSALLLKLIQQVPFNICSQFINVQTAQNLHLNSALLLKLIQQSGVSMRAKPSPAPHATLACVRPHARVASPTSYGTTMERLPSGSATIPAPSRHSAAHAITLSLVVFR